ncbi:hypothetical protein CSW98_09580 [Vibrio sp. HA2012]|uniref:hypothetical protein n=1 Tax=Vibrio sp. HA2012 TaxID=1971595 RepID=UPI000C2BEE6F|nr:hypothetical protein [Vibrio sp. HA2012]PJC86452.1 hypothetical protein CSW98_09580 [Vibrio sp. HA2012]
MHKIILISGLILPTLACAQDMLDTDLHSMLLLNKAKSTHQHQQGQMPGPGGHNEKLRANRNSDIAAYNQTSGGGVSIGNITPQNGAHGNHSTTVIIQGPIINTN